MANVTAFAAEASLPDAARRALEAALPRGVLPKASHWLKPGMAPACEASGLDALEVVDVFDRFVRFGYRGHPQRQVDFGIQLAQVELLRRQHGAPAATIELPPPPPGARTSTAEVLANVAYWEALSFAAALTGPDESPERMAAAAVTLALHLLEADGVPMRFARLDPAAYAAGLASLPSSAHGLRRPEGCGASVLGAAAELYRRLIARGLVDEAIGERIAEQLSVAAMGLQETRAVA